MDIITYQGRQIEAEVIGQIDRRIDCGSAYNASDSLLRDEAGFYYVQREILDAVQHPTTEALRTRVHRVGINAAILWAITELGNGDPWALRCDASNLITPDRGYDDPGEMTLKEATALLDAAPAGVIPDEAPKHAAGITSMFGLDDYTAGLLREELLKRPECSAHDIISGALAYMLEEGAEYPECLKFARGRRVNAKFMSQFASYQNEAKAASYGVSLKTMEAAARYATKNGRTVDEMIADLLECVAGDGSGVEEAKAAASMVASEEEHVLTLRLSAAQYALLKEVVEYDDHESMEEGVMEELREHVVTYFEGGCSGEKVKADEIRSRWDGDEAEIDHAVAHMRRMLGDGTTLNVVDARQETEAA